MSEINVTYICGQTGLKVVSADGLPEGWVVPTYSLAIEDKDRPVPPRYSVVAFSSKSAMDRFIESNMAKSF
ncbi:hypothetical protein LCGC14_0702050 [marine sediment metagenome]|uniref:Uncharacterized protein n=1 Tax=marine sediment metagenome TaxID=412755 RepID=A0A0F9TQ98_9ZZZZ